MAFAVSFFTIGLSSWQIPYQKIALPNAVLGPGLVGVIVLAALPRVLCHTRLWPATLIVGAYVPAAVLARVIYDTLRDPTSHNLWPFEIILVGGPGILAVLVGAAVGGLLATRRDP